MTYITAVLFASVIFALVIVWSLIEFYTESKRIKQFD
mgnify:CR=1 FL=1